MTSPPVLGHFNYSVTPSATIIINVCPVFAFYMYLTSQLNLIMLYYFELVLFQTAFE